MAELLSISKPKARKDHKCDYCKQIIPKGTIYETQLLKNDDLYRWRNHLTCQEIAVKLKLFDDCDDEGVTGDFFRECICEEYKVITNDFNYDNPMTFKERLEIVLKHHQII